MNTKSIKRIVPVIMLTGGLLLTPVSALENQTQATDLTTEADCLRTGDCLTATDEQKSAWEALETEGPPLWASARQKDTGWFDGERIGPPPWAASHQNKADQALKAEQRQQWQDKGESGPPPWAAASRKNKDKDPG